MGKDKIENALIHKGLVKLILKVTQPFGKYQIKNMAIPPLSQIASQ